MQSLQEDAGIQITEKSHTVVAALVMQYFPFPVSEQGPTEPSLSSTCRLLVLSARLIVELFHDSIENPSPLLMNSLVIFSVKDL